MTQSEWEPEFSVLVGEQIQVMRKRAGVSADALAQMCTDIGFPMKRHVVTSLENGRRSSISVGEIIAIATALRLPPLYLLYPLQDPVREVPGPPPLGRARAYEYHDWFRGYPWAMSYIPYTMSGYDPKLDGSARKAWSSIPALERAGKLFNILDDSTPMQLEADEWTTPPSKERVAYLRETYGMLAELADLYRELGSYEVKMFPLAEDLELPAIVQEMKEANFALWDKDDAAEVESLKRLMQRIIEEGL